MPNRPGVAVPLAGFVLTLVLTACESSPPTQPTCTIALAPTTQTFPAAGGTGTVEITASAASCEWTATTDAAWATITSGPSGAGSGLVRYAVSPSSATQPRSTAVVVGTARHTITQDAFVPPPCTYALQPASASIASDGGSGTFDVETLGHCAWTSVSTTTWLTVSEGTSGVGRGVVRYRADPHSSTSDRTGVIDVAGQRFSLTQEGRPAAQCDYSAAPVAFAPCMAAGAVVARVAAGPACAWSVSTDVPWLTTRPSSTGTGTLDLVIDFTSNYDAPRLGVVQVRWPTATAGQNLRVSQAGCRYGVSRSSIPVGAAGGTETFDVLQQSDPTECGGALQDRCVWSAVAGAAWITITSAMPRTGDDRVNISVAANPDTTARTGLVTVRDKIVTVEQAGR